MGDNAHLPPARLAHNRTPSFPFGQSSFGPGAALSTRSRARRPSTRVAASLAAQNSYCAARFEFSDSLFSPDTCHAPAARSASRPLNASWDTLKLLSDPTRLRLLA